MWVAELSIQDIQYETGSGVLVTFSSIQPLLDSGVSFEALARRRYSKSGDKHTYHAVIAKGARHIPTKGSVLVGVESDSLGHVSISLLRVVSSTSYVIEVDVVQAERLGPNHFSLTFKSINPFLEVDIQHKRLRTDNTGAVKRTVIVASDTDVPLGNVLVSVTPTVDIVYVVPALKLSSKSTKADPSISASKVAQNTSKLETTATSSITPFGLPTSSPTFTSSSVFGFEPRAKNITTMPDRFVAPLEPIKTKKRPAPDTVPTEATTSTKKNLTEEAVAAIAAPSALPKS